MKAMTSVNPPFSTLILNGVKKIEWRTKPLPLGWHELYETKKKGGCGKVIGRFEVVENVKFNLQGDTYQPQWLEKGCVSYDFLLAYAKGKDYLYANIIGKVEIYDKPKELSEFLTICKYDAVFSYNSKCGECPYFDKNLQNKTESVVVGLCSNGGYIPITRPPQSWCYVEEN